MASIVILTGGATVPG